MVSGLLTDILEKGEVFYPKGQTLPKTRLQSIGSSQMLIENAQSLLSPENLFRLETAIKSTYISQVACGNNHALLLTSSGFVYSFGSNEFGQLGNPSDE
jgi:alpha-tubulin suppressor-like RCC1 family protein